MTDLSAFAALSPTTLGDVLGPEQMMDIGLRPLWGGIRRIAGPAYTVRCAPGDNLMLHAAIYRAAAGSVIVVQSGDTRAALAGGNVCAVAQRRGIAGFVLDGVVRDLDEVRAIDFPVFARGLMPAPGGKTAVAPLNEPVICGGVRVQAGDIVVADDEGIAVVPGFRQDEVLRDATAKAAAEASQSLDEWEAEHSARVESRLADLGYSE